MKFLKIIMIALSLPVLASRPIQADKQLVQQLVGKEVLQKLVRQTPWDLKRLAHILKLELLNDVAADDYVPEAAELLGQAIRKVAQEEKLAKLLLWQVTTPHGKQHWLLGTHHSTRLGFFSAAGQQQLDTLMAEIDVFMHEGNARGLDRQLIVKAQRQGKKVVPLEDALAITRARMFVGNISTQREAQAETSTAADSDADLLSTATEWERLFREQQAYLQGDLSAVLALQQKDPNKNSDLHAYVVGERNRNWLPEIIAACNRDETCLVAAGYRHFTLDSEAVVSVITMLREHGYDVEPLQ